MLTSIRITRVINYVLLAICVYMPQSQSLSNIEIQYEIQSHYKLLWICVSFQALPSVVTTFINAEMLRMMANMIYMWGGKWSRFTATTCSRADLSNIWLLRRDIWRTTAKSTIKGKTHQNDWHFNYSKEKLSQILNFNQKIRKWFLDNWVMSSEEEALKLMFG